MSSHERKITGNKVAATILWIVGCGMTYAAVDQITDWDTGVLLAATFALQWGLTAGQSPVWRGKGNIIGFALLLVDVVINFGGAMSIIVNIDKMGSVQALTSTFIGYSGMWALWIKGVLALLVSAIVAGLPEYLWKLD